MIHEFLKWNQLDNIRIIITLPLITRNERPKNTNYVFSAEQQQHKIN